MPALVAGIHALIFFRQRDVDGRAKASGSDAVPRTAMPAMTTERTRNGDCGDPEAAALHQPYGFGPFDAQAPDAHFRFEVTTGPPLFGGATGGFGRGPGG